MKSVAFFILLVLSVRADLYEKKMLKAERNCVELTRKPFYNPSHILGKWRVYYTWGFKINECIFFVIKPVSETTQEHFARKYGKLMDEEPDWNTSELLINTGRGEEILMFPDKVKRGRYQALMTFPSAGLSLEGPITLSNFAIKAFRFFKYLIMINCDSFSGYLMARNNDTSVSVKEIVSLIDDVLPGEIGSFACIPKRHNVFKL